MSKLMWRSLYTIIFAHVLVSYLPVCCEFPLKMSPLIELRPNRDLLDPSFSGYKLSLEPVPVYTLTLEEGMEHLLPSDDQYSFLHVKLFGLHNHLYSNPWSPDDVYYIDKTWRLRRNLNNVHSGRLEGMQEVWEMPSHYQRKPGHYNTSLSFPARDLALVSDGAGTLHLVSTTDSTSWTVLFSDEVCGKEKSYVIADSRVSETEGHRLVHCLLQHVEETAGKEGATHFKTILEWITLSEGETSWSISSVRKISGDGGLDYAAIEVGCESVYVASDRPFHFIIDSEVPVELENPMEPSGDKSRFTWRQTASDITVWLPVSNDTETDSQLQVSVMEDALSVCVGDKVLLAGPTWQRLDAAAATWSLETDNVELRLVKAEPGLHWQELVQGDVEGEETRGEESVAVVTDTDVLSEAAPAFNAQQLEECDSWPDMAQLVRLDSHSHSITHQVNLGGHQWLFNAQLSVDQAPAVCLRHDVDGCVWQMSPPTADVWPSEHTGTFLAFGYVQASKTQRKFTVCSPDMAYVAICEASRHVYLYRQPTPVDGDLRNRHTGRRVSQVAKQQLVNLDLQTEILGVRATDTTLYVITTDTILALAIR